MYGNVLSKRIAKYVWLSITKYVWKCGLKSKASLTLTKRVIACVLACVDVYVHTCEPSHAMWLFPFYGI